MKKRGIRLTLMVLALAVVPWTGAAAQDDAEIAALKTEIQELKAGQKAIQKDLQEIKKLIQGIKAGRPAEVPLNLTLGLSDYPTRGDPKAQVVLMEFTDYQCPYCSRHKTQTMPKIQTEYVDTGKVLYVMRDFPLGFHKFAAKASEAAHCAGEQGLYWEMDELLFKQQKQLMPEKLPEYAVAVGAELEPFQACLDSGRHAAEVKSGTADAGKAGITGTPSFILGKMEPGGDKVKFTVRIKGAKGYDSFKTEIDKLLAAK